MKRPPTVRPQAVSKSHWTTQRLSRHSIVSTIIESWRSGLFVTNTGFDDLDFVASECIFKCVESAVFASLLISFISLFSLHYKSSSFLSSLLEIWTVSSDILYLVTPSLLAQQVHSIYHLSTSFANAAFFSTGIL